MRQLWITQISKTLLYQYSRSECWMWIFPWIKVSRYSCSMWDRDGWLNLFSQFLCEWLSSYNLKEFCYLYGWCCSWCEARTSFCMGLICRKLWILSDVFDWLYFIQCLTSSSSMDHLVFDATSSNINEVLSINPSANVFAFGDFNVHQRLANPFWWNW